MATAREQELVDLCFAIGMTAAKGWQNSLKIEGEEQQVIDWIAKSLRDSGFNTQPMGSSHGVLK